MTLSVHSQEKNNMLTCVNTGGSAGGPLENVYGKE